MIPFDCIDRWSPILEDSARHFLNEAEFQAFLAIPEPERARQLRALLEQPIARFTPVNEAYFRARWAEVLRAVCPGSPLTLLEVASGDADMIPQMMARVYPGSRYLTANMNQQLNSSLRSKTQGLPLDLYIFEDDAQSIEQYIGPGSVDVIAFQHAVNDVIQAILCDREGVDTIYADWMETLPAMIRIMQREVAAGTLDEHAKAPFLGLMASLLRVLKPGGVVVISHYLFQLDLDWGYPADLFTNMAPLARSWLAELPGCQEMFLDGFDPQWWIFIKKAAV